MDREWSEKNKNIQALLSREGTFGEAVEQLIAFRGEMFEQISQIVRNYPVEAFSMMPFAGADGYHSKTLAYSIWHIFRIEDIVAHEMIAGDPQILLKKNYTERIQSPIVTTGNELSGEDIAAFSRQLQILELYQYARDVMEATNRILKGLTYSNLKRTFPEAMRAKLRSTGCVSPDEKADWLVDYWCGKDIRGLIQMPFSRHWIMHIEAMRRIKNKLCKQARKGVDPVACCGLSCNHCFLAQWCGSCRTAYNVCSYATCSPDGVCPNVRCCREKGFDGCYDCDDLDVCQTGFYAPSNDGANAVRAQALYIRKYGKKAFLKMQDRLHEKYDFAKVQEILGPDLQEGIRILEET